MSNMRYSVVAISPRNVNNIITQWFKTGEEAGNVLATWLMGIQVHCDGQSGLDDSGVCREDIYADACPGERK